MSKSNTVNYTANDHAIVDALKTAGKPMTLAEINEVTGLELKPGSMTSAIRKGLIAKEDKVSISRPAKREVSTYSFVSADARVGSHGKVYNYTPSENKILSFAATFGTDAEFTLAELSEVCGETVKSGNINSLVKKGNLTKAGSREVDCKVTAKVSTYVFAADIPSEA